MKNNSHRSVLFMPASNERALNKAQSLPVDTIIIDLEDSLHSEQRDNSLALLESALTRDFGFRNVLVRINALDTDDWQGNVENVVQAVSAGGTCNGIVVPKVETVEQLDDLFTTLDNTGDGTNNLTVWIMLESPAAILSARELCGYGKSVGGVLIGTEDLRKALGIPAGIAQTAGAGAIHRMGLLPSLSQLVLAARAAGISVIDGVYANFKDGEGFELEATQGLELGFDGKSLIHPNQIDVANRIFSPGEDEIREAREMISKWKQANSEGHAVCSFDGRMIERLHVEQAEARVALFEQIASRD